MRSAKPAAAWRQVFFCMRPRLPVQACLLALLVPVTLAGEGAPYAPGPEAAENSKPVVPYRSAQLPEPRPTRSDREAAERALEWLEEWPPESDDRTGWWTGGAAGERWNTFLAAQAFLASGSTLRKGKYRAPLKRAYRLLKQDSDGRTDGGCSNWGLAIQAALLGDLLQSGAPRRDRKDLLQRAEQYLAYIAEYQIERGGWGHHPFSPEEHEAEKTGAYPADLLSVTNLMAHALLSLREADVPVDTQILVRVVDCYSLAQNDNGGIAYSSRNTSAEEAGRTAATGYVLRRMLQDDALTELHGRAREILEGIQTYLHHRGHEVGHGHGNAATIHLWLQALHAHASGPAAFAEYRAILFSEHLDEQAEDGSFSFREGSGLIDFTVARESGATSPALTALAAFVLQAPLKHAPSLRALLHQDPEPGEREDR